ncbi:MAG: diaminopimelate decarboxylase [Planctomycetota bacterium]|nr:MAG: diaminopimelate decarboxylase [Planctomycetota bacterium]
MDHFQYQGGELHAEGVPVELLAEQFGTPLYVYSQATLLRHLGQIQEAFAEANPLICYSVKSNGNLALCRLMARHGSGFDVTSAGELHRAVLAGAPGRKIVFAGVGKSREELVRALQVGVFLFNVESEEELHFLGDVARELDLPASVALRVNPDLPPKTHARTDTSVKGVKFGLDIETVLDVARGVLGHAHLRVIGLHMHLGSPILSAEPYRQGAAKAEMLVGELRRMGHPIDVLNMGGGFGIHYRKQEALPAHAFAAEILPVVKRLGCRLVLEPGRFIVGNAGILVSRVLYRKESGGKRFIIQDAAMNDLIRPSLYDAFHRIWPVKLPAGATSPPEDYEADIPGTVAVDVVGPVCESGDFLARQRALPPLLQGDLLAVFSAGAYGMAMASNYNSRPRAAEVLVDGSAFRLIRRRETLHDLVAPELDAMAGW